MAMMQGKKILYVHGFGSSARTQTVERLREAMPEADVVAFDIPLRAPEAIVFLKETAQREQPDLIIGTSMGGMYAEQLKGFWRILVNPAFQIADTMAEHGMVGLQKWNNPRADGQKEFIVTKQMVREYREVAELCFADITDDERQKVWGLFGDEDPLVHTFDLFLGHYPQAVHFHGEHRLTEKVIHHYLLPLIRSIDERQDGRTRPVLMVDFDTLHDSYMQATASMHKAFEALLPYYDIYVLAPSPTNAPGTMAEVSAWVERFLSAPAFNHVVYCDNPALLMADYMVAPRPVPEFPGTVVEWGSPDFKTWEEIITYFSRLNGGAI